MGLARNVMLLSTLLLIVWASFIAVTYVIASTLFPALEQADGDMVLSVARVVVGSAAFALWVYGWYCLTRFWLYRILLRRPRSD